MFRRQDIIQKRLLKIKKQENQSLRMLERQKQELEKVIAENDSLITSFLDSMSAEEVTISRELEGLVVRTKELQMKLEQVEVLLSLTLS